MSDQTATGENEDNPQKAPGLPLVIHSQYIKDFSFENPNGDLSADSVNATLQELIADVNAKYGSEGVYQR